VGVKFSSDQAENLRAQLLMHSTLSNSQAWNSIRRLNLLMFDDLPLADAIEQMLEAGDSFLTELVNAMVMDRLTK
jgi:hypothetical protein